MENLCRRDIVAEERYVRAELFGEFVKRMDERFAHANELAEAL